MASIDTSKRKPRRTKGTPAFTYRNRFAYAFLAAGSALFGIWYLTPIHRIANEHIRKFMFTKSEEEFDRKALFDFGAPRTSKFIKEAIEESQQMNERSTRSTKPIKSTLTISEYFNNIGNEDNSQDQPVAMAVDQSPLKCKQNSKDFELDEPIMKKRRDSDDFEKPTTKPKRAPKSKISSSTSSNRRGCGRNKRQASISDFMRNEQLFSEVTAQHCLADNFSPDDIEMALALSKSEAESTTNSSQSQDSTNVAVVDLLLAEKTESEKSDEIRNKLKQYGFRTAAKQDYDSIATNVMTVKRFGKRCKWANKFTPLTFVDPEKQAAKLQTNIYEILSKQVKTKKQSTEEELEISAHKLSRKHLKSMQIDTCDGRVIHEPDERSVCSDYYVNELFKVCELPATYLLKNWTDIQGRDLSPEKTNNTNILQKKKIQNVYSELEKHFGESPIKSEDEEVTQSQVNSDELNNLERKLIAELVDQEEISIEITSCGSSPPAQTPDKRARMMSENSLHPSEIFGSGFITQDTRSTSPDIFADSDDEDLSASISKPSTISSIQALTEPLSIVSSSETYSSDDVNTVIDTTIERKTVNNEIHTNHCIDLTQDTDSPEIKFTNEFCGIDTITDDKSTSPRISIDLNNSIGMCKSPNRVFEMEADFDSLNNKFEKSPSYKLTMNNVKSNHDNSLNWLLKDLENEANTPTVSSIPLDASQSTSISSSLKTSPFTQYLNATMKNNFLDNTDMKNSHELNLSPMEIGGPSQGYSELDTTRLTFTSTPPKSNRAISFLDRTNKLMRKSVSFSDFQNSPKSNSIQCISDASIVRSELSIDLTGNSSDGTDDDNDGLLLSDDEINYSIWKSNKTAILSTDDKDGDISSPDNSLSMEEITSKIRQSIVDELDLNKSNDSSSKSFKSHSPNKSVLSKQRAEFGILDAAISQPLTQTEESSNNSINWEEASFLDSPPTNAPMNRLSSCKFNQLLSDISEPPKEQPKVNDDEWMDEFDRLVMCQNSVKSANSSIVTKVPNGLDRLLLGDINCEPTYESLSPIKRNESPEKVPTEEQFEQIEVNGNVYNVRSCHKPKPDFLALSEAEILKQLYNYGIKPLKRKQAIKMLEFLYNQTHPIVVAPDLPASCQPTLSRSKSTPMTINITQQTDSNDCLTPTDLQSTTSSGQFREAFGKSLLRFSQTLTPGLCDDFEQFETQTNVTKKSARPLVPLHIAWHNLLLANPELHESVLKYEPIDLQQIYLYFKQQGNRYEPKDLKSFFDRRCIIFRYDLQAPAQKPERHVPRGKLKKAGVKK